MRGLIVTAILAVSLFTICEITYRLVGPVSGATALVLGLLSLILLVKLVSPEEL